MIVIRENLFENVNNDIGAIIYLLQFVKSNT